MLQDELKALLQKANSRRRLRLLTFTDVLTCIDLARTESDHYSYIHGGRVAASYSDRAYATCCVAVHFEDGRVGVWIGETSAKPGASPTRWATGLDVRSDQRKTDLSRHVPHMWIPKDVI